MYNQLTEQEFNNLQVGIGKALIKADPGYNSVNVDGTHLKVNTTWKPEYFSSVTGEVISSPPDSEVKKGDHVYFHYNAVSSALRDRKYFRYHNELYVFINLEGIYCGWREEELVVYHEYILIRRKLEERRGTIGGILIPEQAEEKERSYEGIIVSMPENLKSELRVGDRIFFRQFSNVQIEEEFRVKDERLEGIHRIQYEVVDGIIDKDFNFNDEFSVNQSKPPKTVGNIVEILNNKSK